MNWIFEIYGNTFKALTMQRTEKATKRLESEENAGSRLHSHR